MANPQFPTLASGERLDSSKFSVKYEDTALRTDMQGGYVVSRAKHTRKPRKTFSCAYTYIKPADKDAVASFYENMRGGSMIFDWLNPEDGVTYAVRFKGELETKYAGRGTNKRWDVSFELEQA